MAAPAAVTELLLALPTLYGRGEVLDRAERLVKNARSEAALANLAEIYRLLRAYGLADSVLLDLGEVRGFDYYSGVHFEAYVSGLGAPLVGGGRYDQMLARFGYDCPATGFAFEMGRALLRDGIAGRGAAAARARLLHHRFHGGEDPRARALAAAAGRGCGGGARHHQPAARPSPWPTRAGSSPHGRWSSATERMMPWIGCGDGSRGRERERMVDGRRAARGPAAATFRDLRRWTCLTSWWWARSGATRARARSWTCSRRHVDVVVRYQGGNNAGHTVVVGKEKFVLQSIPSGILHPGCRCVIGCGVVIDPASLIEEMESLVRRGVSLDGNLYISKNAHLIMPYHPALDLASESKAGTRRIGTTGKGVGPAYADKAARIGIRMADLLDEQLFREKLEFNILPEEPAPARDLRRARRSAWTAIFGTYLRYAGWLAPYITDTALLLLAVDRRAGLGPVRGRAGHHAGHRSRDLSLHHVVEHHRRRRVDRDGCAADQDPRRARHLEGVHHPGGRRAVSDRAPRRRWPTCSACVATSSAR